MRLRVVPAGADAYEVNVTPKVIVAAEGEQDQEKASGKPVGNDEEPAGAKSEDPPVNPSAKNLAEAFELELALA